MAISKTHAASISAKTLAYPRSAIREVFDAAAYVPDAIRLEIGEPSFVTPRFIIDGALQAAVEGWTGYTPNGGYLNLRQLLAEKLQRVNGYTVDPDCIVATPGAMNALFAIYLAVLEPGDEVLLPTPGFPNMDEMVTFLGGRPIFYRLEHAEGYLPQIDEIESLITPKTKLIFMNSPANPTGAVFPESTVRALVELAAERGIWLISDEVYDQLILDDDVPHVSAAPILPEAPIVSVYSFSKTYAMTGWRLGYCVAPPKLADALRKLQEPLVSCPSAISQKAAEAALRGPRAEIEAMRTAYRSRREHAVEVAAKVGLDVFRPSGTFYMLANVATSGLTSREFTLRLLEEYHVAVAPGEVFGPGGHGLVRISLAREPDEIGEGMTRIARAIESFGREAH